MKSRAGLSVFEKPLEAKRLRAADLRSLVAGGGVQVLGVDVAPATVVPSEKTLSVVDLPAQTSGIPGLVELIADAVVAKLTAIGAGETAPTIAGRGAIPSAASMLTQPVLDEPQPILLTTTAAAKLLGCSVKAVYHRIAERQIPSSCIVRSGRRLLLHRTKLLEAMERRAGR